MRAWRWCVPWLYGCEARKGLCRSIVGWPKRHTTNTAATTPGSRHGYSWATLKPATRPLKPITAAETFADLYSIGVSTFNAACCEADYRIVDVFCVALAMWRSLPPEVGIASGACMVGNVAAQLWGIRAEPAPPEPIRNLDGRTALTIENRDVERRASTDMTPPPPPPTLPPGAPRARGEVGPGGIPARPILPPGVPLSRVSLRGLAELRRRAAEE